LHNSCVSPVKLAHTGAAEGVTVGITDESLLVDGASTEGVVAGTAVKLENSVGSIVLTVGCALGALVLTVTAVVGRADGTVVGKLDVGTVGSAVGLCVVFTAFAASLRRMAAAAIAASTRIGWVGLDVGGFVP